MSITVNMSKQQLNELKQGADPKLIAEIDRVTEISNLRNAVDALIREGRAVEALDVLDNHFYDVITEL